MRGGGSDLPTKFKRESVHRQVLVFFVGKINMKKIYCPICLREPLIKKDIGSCIIWCEDGNYFGSTHDIKVYGHTLEDAVFQWRKLSFSKSLISESLV